jgi:hypothetical protein
MTEDFKLYKKCKLNKSYKDFYKSNTTKDKLQTNRNEFLQACHYSNMQPLWWNVNIRKSNKWAK